MKNNHQNNNDDIYKQKQEQSLTAISFLRALKENLDPSIAFNIAVDAFTHYMTSMYEKILVLTEKGSQERFDQFRRFYEEYSLKTPYLKIIESTPSILRVNYERCPFHEILSNSSLGEFTYAFCLSDPAFTKKVLPGVNFSREFEIAKGAKYCDHTWQFTKKNE